MNLTLIRNATMRLNYAAKTLLTDPMLSPKGAIRSFAGLAPNPTVDLPLPAEEALAGLDGVLVSHRHPDHLDQPALDMLPKNIPLFCQPTDQAALVEAGFERVRPVGDSLVWEGIEIIRTDGRHGRGEILERMGQVSGFVLRAEGEPTVYWAGDTIWSEPVEETLAAFEPGVVIVHAGGATLPGFEPIIMTAEDVVRTARAVPRATVIAVHMEALDHCPVTRQGLRETADRAGLAADRLLTPADGATIYL